RNIVTSCLQISHCLKPLDKFLEDSHLLQNLLVLLDPDVKLPKDIFGHSHPEVHEDTVSLPNSGSSHPMQSHLTGT
uniref:SNX19 n=1 Tax=Mesocestoides corti TaxID=53468 RepID=A0A5K3EH64_MESCO